MKHFLGTLLVGAVLVATTLSWAGRAVEPGEALPAVVLPDAHGNEHSVPYPGVRHVLFGADMAANELMERAFGELDKGEFTASGLVYMADISGMPGLVARFFALPALRDYPFRVLLARDADMLAFLPREEGTITVVTLSSEGEVSQVRYEQDAARLAELLKPREPNG
ncbi:MAG: hypothetical protein ACOC0M_05590 [Halomonas sp.]